MENGEDFERLQSMNLVIEGHEDTSVVPRKGPLPEGPRHAGLSREPIYLLIAN